MRQDCISQVRNMPIHECTCMHISLSMIVFNSRDRQGMYGMQHFRMPRNPPYNNRL